MKKKHIITQFIISFSLLILCCSFMLLFSLRVHAADDSNPFYEPPFFIGVPQQDTVITSDMVNLAIEGFSPYITSDHWVIVVNEINTRGIVYFYLYNDYTISNTSKSDFLNGISLTIGTDSANQRRIGYCRTDLSESLWGYTTGYNITTNINTLNSSSPRGYVVASSDDVINGSFILFMRYIDIPDVDYSPIDPLFPDLGHDLPNNPDQNTVWTFFYNRITDIGNFLSRGFTNLYQNTKNFLQPALDGIKNSIDGFKDSVLGAIDTVKELITDFKDGVLSVLDQVNNTLSIIGSVFNDFVDLGTDSDGNFSIFTAVRRLIIPDDLDHLKSSFGSFVSSYIDNEKSSISVFVRFIAGLNNDYTNNVVPTFVIPGFTLGGASIPDITISFEFLVPYMGVIRSMTSVFMWLSFIIYMIKDFPNFTRGVFHIAEEDLHPRPVYEVRD